MLEKVEELLKTLEIELAYQFYSGNSDEYIVFDISNENDITYADDNNMEVKKYLTINYWHKKKSKMQNYKKIKKLFKDNGFFFSSMKTLNKSIGSFDRTDDFYGKNFIFTMEEFEDE